MNHLVRLSKYLQVLWNLLFLPERVQGMPRHIQLDITTHCNLQCAMCYSKKVLHPTEKNQQVSFEQFKRLFDDVRPLSINLAASGEPLLHPDFFAITRYASERGCQVIISTNFTVPTPPMIERIVDSGLSIMKISIDGASREVYERVRGPQYDRLYANLTALKQTLAARPASSLKVRFDYVILKTNYTDIAAIVDRAAQFGVTHIYYRICDARGWSAEDKEALLTDSFPAIEREMREAVRRAAAQGVSTNLPELLAKKDEWRFRHEDAVMRQLPTRRPVCILPWVQLFTAVRGDTSYCCSIYPLRDENQGNLFEHDAAQVWNGAAWQHTRRLFKERKNYALYEGCKYCIPVSRRYLLDIVKMFPGFFKRDAS